MRILLGDSGYHKWKQKNGIISRGWADYKGEIRKEFSFIGDEDDLNKAFWNFLDEAIGNFGLIVQTDDEVLAAVDNIASFPLYYGIIGEEFVLSDSLSRIKEALGGALHCENKDEYYASGFIAGRRTVYNNIFQVQAGQVICFNKNSKEISIHDYYLHVHKCFENQNSTVLCDELKRVVNSVIGRLVKSIDGKTIVLFLSGGYDSKLILTSLKNLNYRNVICVSLGGYNTKDVAVAEKVAYKLGYKWVRIDVSQKTWREFRKSEDFNRYFTMMSAYSTFPYMQGLAVKKLIDKGIVTKDCVVITGNSGDAIEGADVTHSFVSGKKYSIDDIKEAIRFKHYTLNGYKKSIEVIRNIDISDCIGANSSNSIEFSDEECENIFEYFNWRERQCKFVVSDVHNYEDYLGVDWRLPLWDREFQDFWLGVSYEQRYDRKLYYRFVEADNLPSANNVSVRRKIFNRIKSLLGNTTNVLYIPKSLWNYRFSSKYYYCAYGMITFKELLDILKTGAGNREPHMEGIVRIMYRYY
nr:asparagine synthase-related protein [uncultured Butyrivibrio sp.]